MMEIFNPMQRWFGGFYELAIQVGPHGNDAAILNLLQTIWSEPEISGPYDQNDIEPHSQEITSVNSDERHYYGYIRLNDDQVLACGSYVVKEDCDPGGSDWVLLYVPAQEVQWKLGGNSSSDDILLPELSPFVSELVKIADEAYRQEPFKMALLGFEVSGGTYAESITAKEIGRSWMGVLLPEGHPLVKEVVNGQRLSSGLVWYFPQRGGV